MVESGISRKVFVLHCMASLLFLDFKGNLHFKWQKTAFSGLSHNMLLIQFSGAPAANNWSITANNWSSDSGNWLAAILLIVGRSFSLQFEQLSSGKPISAINQQREACCRFKSQREMRENYQLGFFTAGALWIWISRSFWILTLKPCFFLIWRASSPLSFK
jgi:hypothetical protein